MITLSLLVRVTYIWVLFFAHIPFVVNRTFNRNANGEVATTSPSFYNDPHRSHVHSLWKLHLARPSHPGHSITFLLLESPSRNCAKLHTVAASNNRDHPARSLSSSPLASTINCSLASQALLEVTHQDHSIGITLLLLVRATYSIYRCDSSRTSRSWWIAHSTQRQPRVCITNLPKDVCEFQLFKKIDEATLGVVEFWSFFFSGECVWNSHNRVNRANATNPRSNDFCYCLLPGCVTEKKQNNWRKWPKSFLFLFSERRKKRKCWCISTMRMSSDVTVLFSGLTTSPS